MIGILETKSSTIAREIMVQSQVETDQRLKKWYLMPPCLTLNIIRYGSRVKWSNPEKGVALSPTPWCSSYRKGSLRVTLDIMSWETKQSGLPGYSVWGTHSTSRVRFWTCDKVELGIRLFHEQDLSKCAYLLYIPELRRVSWFPPFCCMDFSVCSMNAWDSCIAKGGN